MTAPAPHTQCRSTPGWNSGSPGSRKRGRGEETGDGETRFMGQLSRRPAGSRKAGAARNGAGLGSIIIPSPVFRGRVRERAV
ncbi:hypothetical protein FRZ61_24610 [Hypericibacter adhaerens]|uniref:Uncharacterized protein n=1 Tax=Hypericibacter adhaerens TaxID=2602016 RepID=A0A5J6MY86_9PROT|nr:hypothetical protein FRZ61_24610 [Hypericibacter adhaerens]